MDRRNILEALATPRKLVAALAIAGVATGSTLALSSGTRAPEAAASAASTPAIQLPDIAALVERATPAVVQISVEGKSRLRPAAGMPDLEEGPFGEFFRRFQPPGGSQAPESRGSGSGFIIESGGYILTNSHVVEGASRVTVKLDDKREFEAKVVGTDPATDLALLEIEAKGLPVLPLGDSEKLKVGQWVFAIGAPFGLERTATQGIVSAVGRSLPNGRYVPFIQTDVAVNPGSSGGPLFDLSGRVVGINSQIYSRSGGYMGLSFAIPIKTAMGVVEQLKATGKVSHGWLGVTVQPISRALADSFGMKDADGALVANVNPEGPAAKAGLRAGDVVTAFAGKPVRDSSELVHIVGATTPGKTVDVAVIRDGKPLELKLNVGALPGANTVASGAPTSGLESPRLNVTVAEVPAEQKRALNVTGGVQVTDVGEGPAQKAGLRAGDVVLSLAGKDVTSTENLREIVKGLPADKPVPMLVKRGEASMFLALSIPSSRG